MSRSCDLRDGLLAALVIIVVALGARTAALVEMVEGMEAKLQRGVASIQEQLDAAAALDAEPGGSDSES